MDSLLLGWWWGEWESTSSTLRSNWSGVCMLTGFSWRGFQYLKISCKTLLCASFDGEPGLCPKAALDCFSLVSHPLPSLINNCLNLPTETQGRSWRLNEGSFLWLKKWGTQKGLVPRTPTVSQGRGEEPQMAWVQLSGPLEVMSSPWPLLTFSFFVPSFYIVIRFPFFFFWMWPEWSAMSFPSMKVACLVAPWPYWSQVHVRHSTD